MNRVFLIICYIYKFIFSKLNPIKYATFLGVNLGENIKFYGMKPGMFSTEPWLISIGDNSHITSGVTFITHDGGTLILRKKVPDLEITAPITIGSNVYIGVNVILLPGTILGDNCIVGAGAVLKGNYPSGSVIAGIPGKVIKTTDEYLEKAKLNSLKVGHLSGVEKEKELKKIFKVKN